MAGYCLYGASVIAWNWHWKMHWAIFQFYKLWSVWKRQGLVWLTTVIAQWVAHSITNFLKFSRPSWTKMSEISINTVGKIDEVEQKNLLITCTAKLYIDIMVLPYIFRFSPKRFSENSTHPPFITFARVVDKVGLHARHMKSLLTRKRTRKQKQRLKETEEKFWMLRFFCEVHF